METYRKKQVLWLEITVGHTTRVHVVKSIEHALGDISSLLFRKASFFDDSIEKFPALHEFHDKIAKVALEVLFKEFDDVWAITYEFKVGYLILESISISPEHFGAIDLFHCVLFESSSVFTNKDNGKSAIANLGKIRQYDCGANRSQSSTFEVTTYLSFFNVKLFKLS
jgi:hypothetical protein